MSAEHEFFQQPAGNPPWCFCRQPDCTGWAAYVAWYQSDTGGDEEPDDDTVQTHRLINKELAALVGRYRELFGVEPDFNTALDLKDIEKKAEPRD